MQFGREEEEPTYVGTSSKFAIGKERNRLLVSELLKIVMNTDEDQSTKRLTKFHICEHLRSKR